MVSSANTKASVKKVYAFDFDGTLTTRDTLIEFIRFAKGNVSFIVGFLLFSPILVLMKLGCYPNWKAKQKVFSYFFKGMSIREFEEKCKNFAECRAELIRLKGLKTVDKAVDENAKVVIVSASIENWVRAFFRQFGLDMVIISGTKIEVKNAVVTGQFIGNNCYGPEKVRRIQELFPDRKQYKLIAFGDSKGDRELLAYADESHYKPFRK